MSEKLSKAVCALLSAIEEELEERDKKINDLEYTTNILESKVCYLNDKLDHMQRNLKDAAGIFTAAAAALQDGLDH
jgi:predicted  nucleic acid-binding Zn-ribbon protein